MKKNLITILLLLFSFMRLVIAQDSSNSEILNILGPTVDMYPGESRDFTETFPKSFNYSAYSLSLIDVTGADASLVDVTLNTWSQTTSKITIEITISLDPSAPPGSELSFAIVYRHYFTGEREGRATITSYWTINVISGSSPVADFTGSPKEGAAPLTVQFTDQSTGNITSRNWDFGDGGTSTNQNPSHTYQNAGTYTVKLTITGLGGSDSKTRSNYITVNEPAPVADFTSSPTEGVAPLTVQFTDQSTGNITSWNWNFGDGQASSEQNPLQTYQNLGTYTVSLTVEGPDGSDTKTLEDYINVTPGVFYVQDWGFIGTNNNRIGGWDLTPSNTVGNVSIGGNVPPVDWSAIRGGFPEDVAATRDDAIIVTGKMEFQGDGFVGWSNLRYGLFYNDSAGVVKADPTANNNLVWSGVEDGAWGYLFTPYSGTVDDHVTWGNGDLGTQGVVRGGAWISSLGNGTALSLGINDPLPAEAEGTAGVYDFGISVQPQADGTNEVRFYFVKEDNSYWYGGIVSDTTAITDTFNGVCFSVRSDNGYPAFRALLLSEIYIDRGEPIEIPMSPSPPVVENTFSDTTLVAGGNDFTRDLNSAPIVFSDPNGDELIYTANSSDPSIANTSVSDNILNVSPLKEGSATITVTANDGKKGTASTDFTVQVGVLKPPENLKASTQDSSVLLTWDPPSSTSFFTLEHYCIYCSEYPNPCSNPYLTDTTDVNTISYIHKYPNPGEEWYYTVTAIYNNGLESDPCAEIKVVVVDVEVVEAQLPTEFALKQNYPNPFNPTTTIRYQLPVISHVDLCIYTLLGQKVTTLISKEQPAGYYNIEWNAKGYASGIYLYKLITDKGFIQTRKLVLLK